jgi:hypothetical protein
MLCARGLYRLQKRANMQAWSRGRQTTNTQTHRVVLASLLPIGLLDRPLVCIALDAKDRVVVSVCAHHHAVSATSAAASMPSVHSVSHTTVVRAWYICCPRRATGVSRLLRRQVSMHRVQLAVRVASRSIHLGPTLLTHAASKQPGSVASSASVSCKLVGGHDSLQECKP